MVYTINNGQKQKVDPKKQEVRENFSLTKKPWEIGLVIGVLLLLLIIVIFMLMRHKRSASVPPLSFGYRFY